MLNSNKVGLKISSMRKKVGLSQEKLAEMLCISPQAISKWETNISYPDISLRAYSAGNIFVAGIISNFWLHD